MKKEIKKEIIKIPKGIRYLSQWKEFNLPDHPCIINKTLTGCGFTEWCIRNDKPIVLCSPRKILLINKEKQHQGEIYYARNEYENVISVDIDLSGKKRQKKSKENIQISKEAINLFNSNLKTYLLKTKFNKKIPKILVTYDSFRLVKDVLNELNILKEFNIVVDEFQAIFTDSRFKSESEIEFIDYLRDIEKVCYVSATPMMDEYLYDLDDFCKLDYIVLDWKSLEPSRIEFPNIIPVPYRGSLVTIASDIIKDYKSGNFEKDLINDDFGNIIEVESKEVVIYVNSVNNIADIIKTNNLTLENCNVLCADTDQNKEKIKKAFGIKFKKDLPKNFLKDIPKEGEPHKMFTLCTKTVYLGADFYSTNARTVVLSDGNIECLAVDISLDLLQILGRQRLSCNPWKNYAELYFKAGTGIKEISEEEFNEHINRKVKNTEALIQSYELTPEENKPILANVYLDMTRDCYKNNYISISRHSGSNIKPVFNKLVKISEKRAFDLKRKEYYSQFTVISEIEKHVNTEIEDVDLLFEFIKNFNKETTFMGKMKLLCKSILSNLHLKDKFLKSVPKEFKNFYLTLGPFRIATLGYRRSNIVEDINKKVNTQNNELEISNLVYREFQIGERYSRISIKELFEKIYSNLGIDPQFKIQATEIEKYFEVERTKISNKQTGKRDEGFKLIRKKL